jgi:hypothetical protein
MLNLRLVIYSKELKSEKQVHSNEKAIMNRRDKLIDKLRRK